MRHAGELIKQNWERPSCQKQAFFLGDRANPNGGERLMFKGYLPMKHLIRLRNMKPTGPTNRGRPINPLGLTGRLDCAPPPKSYT